MDVINSTYSISQMLLLGQVGKKSRRGVLRSLLCCFSGSGSSKASKGSGGSEGRCSPQLSPGSPRYLLPTIRHQDMHKKCMVIDLDETLVHSSFKVGNNIYINCYYTITISKNVVHQTSLALEDLSMQHKRYRITLISVLRALSSDSCVIWPKLVLLMHFFISRTNLSFYLPRELSEFMLHPLK